LTNNKNKKQCRAFSISTKNQCRKKALRSTNYCWLHYPKKEVFISIFISAAFCLFLSLPFSEPLIRFLSKCSLLYYLDNNNPIIENIAPDISKHANINKEIKNFKIIYDENESGLDLNKSSVAIYMKQEGNDKPLKGELVFAHKEMNLKLSDDLKYGEYLMDIQLVDKAKNQNKQQHKFFVKEQEDLGISIRYETFDESQDKKEFLEFVEKRKKLLSDSELFIYYINFHNKADKLLLRSIYFTVNLSNIIWDWQEIGSIRVKNAKSYNLVESANKGISKNRVFVSQRL
jgi:hypothetical protein